jgi:hypothetical protein
MKFSRKRCCLSSCGGISPKVRFFQTLPIFSQNFQTVRMVHRDASAVEQNKHTQAARSNFAKFPVPSAYLPLIAGAQPMPP